MVRVGQREPEIPKTPPGDNVGRGQVDTPTDVSVRDVGDVDYVSEMQDDPVIRNEPPIDYSRFHQNFDGQIGVMVSSGKAAPSHFPWINAVTKHLEREFVPKLGPIQAYDDVDAKWAELQEQIKTVAGSASLQRTYPFTGIGATARHPWGDPLTTREAYQLWRADNVLDNVDDHTQDEIRDARALIRQYENPASFTLGSSNPWFYRELTADGQIDPGLTAEVLLKRPINTWFPDAYEQQRPSRLQVINYAAQKYGVPADVIAATILNEQWDQSSNEDRAEFAAAYSHRHNTSLGLGQIVVSTAFRKELVQDVIPDDLDEPDEPLGADQHPHESREMPSRGDHKHLAMALTSDELNIMATAAYLRHLIATMPSTEAELQEVWHKDFSASTLAEAYAVDGTPLMIDHIETAQNGGPWSEQVINAVIDQYTQRPWQKRAGGWGKLGLRAYDAVKSTGLL